MSCEAGKVPSVAGNSRIVNGKSFFSRIPVCQSCPIGTYAEDIGSTTCQPCPKYHTTLTIGTPSLNDCIRKLVTTQVNIFHNYDEFNVIYKIVMIIYLYIITAQPLLLECAVTGSSGHVVVDCQTNRKIVSTMCSFDNGLNHTCMFIA